jgi:hypothetical protein
MNSIDLIHVVYESGNLLLKAYSTVQETSFVDRSNETLVGFLLSTAYYYHRSELCRRWRCCRCRPWKRLIVC